MSASEIIRKEAVTEDMFMVRTTLEKYDRSKILEVYFSRVDGRVPDFIKPEYEPLYGIELDQIKAFLLGQHPQDTLLHKIFRIMT